MSADNWAICPNIDNHPEPVGSNAERVYTFREDYEIWGAENGTVIVHYSGHCTECKAGIDFEHTHDIPRPA